MTVIVLLTLLHVVGQAQTDRERLRPQFDDDGSIHKVVEAPGLSSDQLYSLLRLKMATYWKDADKVLDMDDRVSGVLAGDGIVSQYVFADNGYSRYQISFLIEIKDGKYRYWITPTLWEYEISGISGSRAWINMITKGFRKDGRAKNGIAESMEYIISIGDDFDSVVTQASDDW